MNERYTNTFQTHFIAIQNRWRCELSSCRNFRFTYLVVDRRHYALNSNDLRAWNAAINKGEATIHSPPVYLHPKPLHVSKKRKARTGYSSNPEDYSPKRQNRWHPGIHYHIHQGHSKHSKAIVMSSSPLSSPPTRAGKRPPSSSSSSSFDLDDIRESNEGMDIMMKKLLRLACCSNTRRYSRPFCYLSSSEYRTVSTSTAFIYRNSDLERDGHSFGHWLPFIK